MKHYFSPEEFSQLNHTRAYNRIDRNKNRHLSQQKEVNIDNFMELKRDRLHSPI